MREIRNRAELDARHPVARHAATRGRPLACELRMRCTRPLSLHDRPELWRSQPFSLEVAVGSRWLDRLVNRALCLACLRMGIAPVSRRATDRGRLATGKRGLGLDARMASALAALRTRLAPGHHGGVSHLRLAAGTAWPASATGSGAPPRHRTKNRVACRRPSPSAAIGIPFIFRPPRRLNPPSRAGCQHR